MIWLLIAVICIIAWNVVRGYTRGVLRMVYSLAAWVVMLTASTMAAPYVRDYILSQTGIEPVILNGIEKQKAAAGLFMSDAICKSVIDQCSHFADDGDDHYLILTFNKIVDAFKDLSDEQKTAY